MAFTGWIVRLLTLSTAGILLFGCAGEEREIPPTADEAQVVAPHPSATVITSRPSPARMSRFSRATASKKRNELADRETTESQVRVSGRIFLTNQSPAANAMVELYHHQPGLGRSQKVAQALTDGEGQYSLKGKDHSALALGVSGDFANCYLMLETGGSGFSEKPGVRDIEQNVTVEAAHTLSGRVIDGEGKLLAGIPVQLTPSFNRTPAENKGDRRPRDTWKTTSTAEGEFSFGNVGQGAWIVGAKAEGLAPLSLPVHVPGSNPVTLQLTYKGGIVHGTVVHKLTGEPVAGATVEIGAGDMNQLSELEHQQTTSTADGSFRFDNLSTGPLRLHADGAQQKLWVAPPRPAPLRLADGESTNAVITMYSGHTITGLVYDKDTSEPLAGAILSTFSSGKDVEAETGTDGTYKLENVVPYTSGRASVEVSLEGYAALGADSSRSSWANVELADDGSPARADFPMEQKIAVSGRVVTEDDVPVSNAVVRVNSSYLAPEPQLVNADGSFTGYMRPFSDGYIEAEAQGFVKSVLKNIKVTNKPIDGLKVVMKVGATVSGRVSDSDGKAVEGATVQVTRQYGSFGYIDDKTISGADGEFTIADLPEEAKLVARHDGYAESEQQTLTLKPGEARTNINLVLRDAKNHTISGVVVFSSGEPVANARVSLYPAHGYNSAATNDDGSFTLDGLPQGTFDLQVTSPRHTIVHGVKTGTKDLKIVIETPQESKTNVTLIGTVVDDISGDVVRDFEVKPIHSPLQVERLSEPGKFRISGMSSRIVYPLEFSSSTHESQIHRTEGGRDGQTLEQTFRLTTPGGITGRVVRSDGTPAADLTVANYGIISRYDYLGDRPMKHTVTGSDGSFTLAPSPAGNNALKIHTPDPIAEVALEADVKSGEILDLGDIEIGGGGRIRGRIVRGQEQEQVAGAEVHVASVTQSGVQKTLAADNEGSFEVAGLKDGRYAVSAENVRTFAIIENGSTEEVVLVLGSVTVSGNITTGDKPYDGWVGLSSTENRFQGNTIAGKYTIKNVTPGKYKIVVSSPMGGPYSEDVTVPDQAEFTKDIHMPDGRVRVLVVDEQGNPVPGISMELSRNPPGGGSSQASGPDGIIVFIGLVPGTYTLTVFGPTQPGQGIQQVEVIDGQTKEIRVQTRKL